MTQGHTPAPSGDQGGSPVPAGRLDIGGVFSRIFETYRDQAALFLPAAFIVFLPVAIIGGLAQGGVASAVILGIIAAVLNVIATYAYQGIVVEAVRDIQDGVRDFELGALFRSIAPMIFPLFLASLLAGLGIVIGLILLVVPGLILLTLWALIAPSIVLERRGVMEAFGRSRELVRGNGWQVFAVIAVVFIIQLVLSAVLNAIIAVFAANVVGSAVATLLTNMLVAPISAIAAAIMFLELRRLRGEEALPAGAGPGEDLDGAGGGVPGAPDTARGGGMAEPGAGGIAEPGGAPPPSTPPGGAGSPSEPGGPPPAAGPQSPR